MEILLHCRKCKSNEGRPILIQIAQPLANHLCSVTHSGNHGWQCRIVQAKRLTSNTDARNHLFICAENWRRDPSYSHVDLPVAYHVARCTDIFQLSAEHIRIGHGMLSVAWEIFCVQHSINLRGFEVGQKDLCGSSRMQWQYMPTFIGKPDAVRTLDTLNTDNVPTRAAREQCCLSGLSDQFTHYRQSNF